MLVRLTSKIDLVLGNLAIFNMRSLLVDQIHSKGLKFGLYAGKY